MDNDLIDQETCGLLVQLVRQKFGTKVEIVGMKLANRRTDYAVFLATLRFPSLEVVVKLAGPRAPYPYPSSGAWSMQSLRQGTGRYSAGMQAAWHSTPGGL